MHMKTLDRWKHAHEFEVLDSSSERKVLLVVGLTLVTMVAEIATGMLSGSMALLADGWHMGTHAVALGIAALAYYFARKHAQDRRYTFGTGKIGVLGGFSSAVVLAVVALLMAIESIVRLINPHPILYNEAMAVAGVGLMVNLISALILQKPYRHGNGDKSAHQYHHDDDHDHNMRGAFLHVLADALTSVLALVALGAGKIWHWVWTDPLMGIIGALLIAQWSRSLLRDTGKILLDRDADPRVIDHIYELIEGDADNRIADLHLWKVGSNKLAAIISLVTHFPQEPAHYKELLRQVTNLAHITVEVIQCNSSPCLPFDGD